MAFALVTGLVAAAASGGGNFTSGTIDTSGADLIVLSVSYYAAAGARTNTISDSKTNTWIPLTGYLGADFAVQIYYAKNPTVGASHDFTCTSNNTYATMCVEAFSGAHLTAPFDQENGASEATGTTRQPGSVTPSEGNELVVTAAMIDDPGGAFSINGSYAIAQTGSWTVSAHEGGALAYWIQTTATATNPTWTISQSVPISASIATFKSAAGGGGPTNHFLSILGVGT